MKLENSTITLFLPDDLEWVEQYTWTKTKEKSDVTLDGSLVIQTAQQTKGMPITLKGGSDFAWMNKGDIETLKSLADAAENMTLTLSDGTTLTVRFRYADGAFEASPIAPNWEKFNNVVSMPHR